MLRLAALAAPIIAVLAGVAFIAGGALTYKSKRDEAFIRCSIAQANPNHLILQKDGTYKSTAPSITLRWSWRRRDYLCVYHDLKGHETVRPAPRSVACIGGDQARNRC
jgi:hypothetical protein